ncbi:MAG: hypothetical protein JWO31_2779, partial [Phycisphaerales bacterium]|nr:hypothetical protein [Phycisphaerales bacterium]
MISRDPLHFLPLLLAQINPAVDARWTFLPQLSPWLLGLFFVLSAGAAVYLYRAQRRVASRRAVVSLAVIRTLLIGMVFVMLLGAGRVFTRTGASSGTLWVVVDQSESMSRADPQATPIERLRWADALGLLPDGVRPGAPDRLAARLGLLGADVSHYQALLAQPADAAAGRKRVDAVVRGLKAWNSRLTGVADAADKDPAAASVPELSKTLRSTADGVAKAIEKIDGRQKPEEAQGDLAWADVRQTLAKAAGQLAKAADESDKAVLAKNDPKVAAAIEQVGKLSRAELAKRAIEHKPAGGDASAAAAGGGGFEAVLPRQAVKVMGFGERAVAASPESREKAAQAVAAAFDKPVAPATDLASGLLAVNDQLSQDEPASVVVVTDGRQTKRDADAPDAVRRLAARGVRVYALGAGTDRVAPDAAVETA